MFHNSRSAAQQAVMKPGTGTSSLCGRLGTCMAVKLTQYVKTAVCLILAQNNPPPPPHAGGGVGAWHAGEASYN
jgi:hypothetical protein